jgi:adenylosuccinate synthase
VLNGFNTLPVCVAYDVCGERVTEMPASLTQYRNAKPIYKNLPGWGGLPAEIWNLGYDKLPQTLKNYISFLEHEVDCPVKIVSVGPQRHETIIR